MAVAAVRAAAVVAAGVVLGVSPGGAAMSWVFFMVLRRACAARGAVGEEIGASWGEGVLARGRLVLARDKRGGRAGGGRRGDTVGEIVHAAAPTADTRALERAIRAAVWAAGLLQNVLKTGKALVATIAVAAWEGRTGGCSLGKARWHYRASILVVVRRSWACGRETRGSRR